MGNVWKIKVLKTGDLELYKTSITMNKGHGILMNVPVFFFALYNGQTKVLVDTGMRDTEWAFKTFGKDIPFKLPESERFENVLKAGMGWTPDEVDIIIHTHLHYDHCGNDCLFKNVKFYLQKSEWETAFNPIEYQDYIYIRDLYDWHSVNYFNWRFVDGEEEIIEGIKVFPTPGHTNGHQSILVNTQEGAVCLTGDVCQFSENLIDNIPPDIVTSNYDVAQSYKEIKKRAKLFIPGHEPSVKNFQTDNFPSLRE